MVDILSHSSDSELELELYSIIVHAVYKNHRSSNYCQEDSSEMRTSLPRHLVNCAVYLLPCTTLAQFV
jgi:hypothetical protein